MRIAITSLLLFQVWLVYGILLVSLHYWKSSLQMEVCISTLTTVSMLTTKTSGPCAGAKPQGENHQSSIILYVGIEKTTNVFIWLGLKIYILNIWSSFELSVSERILEQSSIVFRRILSGITAFNINKKKCSSAPNQHIRVKIMWL